LPEKRKLAGKSTAAPPHSCQSCRPDGPTFCSSCKFHPLPGWETGRNAVNLFLTKKQPFFAAARDSKRGTAMNRHVNVTDLDLRQDLAAAFRWTARLDLHEAVANHFSLAVNPTGTRFLIRTVDISAGSPRPRWSRSTPPTRPPCPVPMRRTRRPGDFTARSTAPAPMRGA
jgi:hypothetical protein